MVEKRTFFGLKWHKTWPSQQGTLPVPVANGTAELHIYNAIPCTVNVTLYKWDAETNAIDVNDSDRWNFELPSFGVSDVSLKKSNFFPS